MRNILTSLFFLIVFIFGFSSMLIADESFVPRPLGEGEKYVPGRIIVQFKEYALPQHHKQILGGNISLGISSIDYLNTRFQVFAIHQLFQGSENSDKSSGENLAGYYVLEFGDDVDVMQAILEYGKDQYVVLAQPDYIYDMRLMPNDPYLSNQYWLDDPVFDHDIDAPETWEYRTGTETVIVGVNDTGVLWDHPDLINSIWQNLGEDADGDGHVIENGAFDPGDINGIDDDGSGKIDDFIGWDWIHVGSSNVYPGEDGINFDNDPTDFHGHGTNISGLIAAATNNSTGVSGIAGGFRPRFPGVRIMCLRSGYIGTDTLGHAHTWAGTQAMYYAVQNGVSVINISFGPGYVEPCQTGYGFDSAMRSAIINALNNDVVVTVASGNDNVDCADYMAIIDGVINVAALNQDDNKAYYSNYGSWIHISAAGNDMYTTDSEFGVATYNGWQGTSYSAPVVAGVAALLRSHDSHLTNDSISALLMNTADPLSNPNLGAGRVNAYNALLTQPIAYFTSDAPDSFPSAPPFTIDFTDASPTTGITDWEWDFGDGTKSSTMTPTHEYTTTGIFDVSLTITSPIGNNTYTYPKRVFAVGDSMWSDKISELEIGDTAIVYFYLKNEMRVKEIILPVEYTGDADLTMISTVFRDGTRTDYFEYGGIIGGHSATQRVIKLKSDNNNNNDNDPLPSGDGPICYLKFIVGAEGTSDIILYEHVSGTKHYINGEYYKYSAEYTPGFVSTDQACQGICGDANNDTDVNVSDAVWIINYVFVGGDAPQPILACGDANGDTDVNVSDAVWIINYVFVGGDSPGDCVPGSWGGDDCCPFE
jgi:subtilisin family serine protease